MTGEQVKVLVVDDEESVRSLLQRILEEAGYSVVTAADGQEALYQVSLGEAHVLLMDIKMPKMSGLEVLSKLTATSSDYCVIMVTSTNNLQTAVEALKLGAYDYITKPFDHNDVTQKVLKAVERWKRQLQEKKRYIEMQKSIAQKTQLMQEQFIELLNSLSREHKLMQGLSSKQAGGGKELVSSLPEELQEPLATVEEFRDALLRILRRA